MRTEVIATPDPPPRGIPNPIHGDEGAAGAGYAGALVAGVRTYGWVVEAVLGVAGDRWATDGWADVSLRRPLYAGERLAIDVQPDDASPDGWSVRATAVAGDRLVLDGRVGLGRAAFAGEIEPPSWSVPADPPPLRPTYTIDSVPTRSALRPLGVTIEERAARRIALDELGQQDSAVPAGTIHPWFLAARMAPLTRHNFTYGPTIHVRTQIQHLAAAPSGGRLTIGAQIVDRWERNEHWYQLLDGSLWVDQLGSAGAPVEVARLRHTTIFRPRGTVMPPPLTDADLASG